MLVSWLLATLSGVLLFLSFPKFGSPAFAWLALAPLLVALHRARGRRGFLLGLTAGFVGNLGIYYWIAIVMSQYGGLSYLVTVPLMSLLCLVIALLPAVFGWAMSRFLARFGTAAYALAPVAWVALELFRSRTMLRFAWCLLGYSQAVNLPYAQLARLFGVYGISFLLVGGAAALAYAIAERGGRATSRVLVVFVFVASAAYWDGRRQLAAASPETGSIRVGLIQANIPQDVKWDPAYAAANFQKHLALTGQALARGARFVVWPESSVPGFYDESEYLSETLGGVASRGSASVLFGNDDRIAAPDGEKYYVGAKMVGADGVLRYRYHKINLVPFGEYVPFHSVLTLGGRYAARLTENVSDFTPGEDLVLGELPGGHRFGAFICYEAIYPDLISGFAGKGAELLVNITNDAWYGTTSAPHQHFAMASLRAVETGRYLVRAANTGITAVVDPRGRVLERTSLFVPAALVRDVPFVSATTFYTRHGDVLAWTCGGLFAAALLASFAGPRAAGRPLQ